MNSVIYFGIAVPIHLGTAIDWKPVVNIDLKIKINVPIHLGTAIDWKLYLDGREPVTNLVPIHLGTAIDWKHPTPTTKCQLEECSYSLRDGDRLETFLLNHRNKLQLGRFLFT